MDRYNGTTKEQRKMAQLVAANVLIQLKKRAFTVDWGAYLKHPNRSGLWENGIQGTPKKILKECRVCAKGAMFISRALLFNEYRFCNSPDATSRADFGTENADLIEAAFEGFRSGDAKGSLSNLAFKFGSKYKFPRTRLKAIMENVIANKGVFRPDKAVSK